MDYSWLVLVQARMNSKRFPGKVMQRIGREETLLEHILEKLKTRFPNSRIVVCTGTGAIHDTISSTALEMGVRTYRGSESDVLSRLTGAAEVNRAEHLVRVCADNLFVDMELLDELLEAYDGQDYASHRIDGVPAMKTHYGFFAELVTLESLNRVAEHVKKKSNRELVTRFIYDQDDVPFDILWLDKTGWDKRVRLTIDTPEDLATAREILALLRRKRKEETYKTVLEEVLQDEDLIEQMGEQIAENE